MNKIEELEKQLKEEMSKMQVNLKENYKIENSITTIDGILNDGGDW